MSNPDRASLVEKFNDQLREIEIYFNTVTYWNTAVRKPDEAEIPADPDGQMQKMANALAETLCKESKHKIPRDQWLMEIRRLAIDKFEFTEEGARKVDWQFYAYEYFLECTPLEALQEDLSNG